MLHGAAYDQYFIIWRIICRIFPTAQAGFPTTAAHATGWFQKTNTKSNVRARFLLKEKGEAGGSAATARPPRTDTSTRTTT